MGIIEGLSAQLEENSGSSRASVSALTQTSLFESKEHREYLESVISEGRNARLLYWEVENFAQYDKERFEFGEHWVLLLKAFNSSGKSNALKALQYNLTTTGVGISRAKKFIKHGRLRAVITTVWSDGVEVEYHLQRTSATGRSSFKNGYRVYKRDEQGIRTEIYNNMVDGRFVQTKETPSFVKRYFNLAEVNGKYLNFMRGSEGLPVLDQSPQSLNKILSQAADLETSEQALKQMTADNKEVYQELEASDVRISSYSKDIVDRRHLTKEVVDGLVESNQRYLEVEKRSDLVEVVLTTFKGLNGLRSLPKVRDGATNVDGLTNLQGIFSGLTDLNGVASLPAVSLSSDSDLEQIESVLRALVELNGSSPEFGTQKGVSSTGLDEVYKVSSLLSELSAVESYGSVEASGTVDLGVVRSLQESLGQLKDLEVEIAEVDKKRFEALAESESILANLKEQGYPIGVCSHCGHLSFTKPFELGGVNIPDHNHV